MAEDGIVTHSISVTTVDDESVLEQVTFKTSAGFDVEWTAFIDGSEAVGTVGFVSGDNSGHFKVRFAGDFEFVFEIERSVLQYYLGIALASPGGRIASGARPPQGTLNQPYAARKRCVCFGKPTLSCTTENCDFDGGVFWRQRCSEV